MKADEYCSLCCEMRDPATAQDRAAEIRIKLDNAPPEFRGWYTHYPYCRLDGTRFKNRREYQT